MLAWPCTGGHGRRELIGIVGDRKSTRLNSSHTVIYTLSLHDALPISDNTNDLPVAHTKLPQNASLALYGRTWTAGAHRYCRRSEEHTSELQSHSDLHSFPTRRSSDLRQYQRPARSPYKAPSEC